MNGVVLLSLFHRTLIIVGQLNSAGGFGNVTIEMAETIPLSATVEVLLARFNGCVTTVMLLTEPSHFS